MPRSTPSLDSTPNFDRLARVYRAMELLSFGSMLERCRFHFLPQLKDARRALVLGDGDGRFTARLLAANPAVQVDAIDASPAMLAAMERRAQSLGASPRLRAMHADIRRFTATPESYDLVVTHFFLDCLMDAEVDSLAVRIRPALAPGAVWLISEFSIPERGWKRQPARWIVRLLYFAFGMLTGLKVRQLPRYAHILDRQRWRCRQRRTFLFGLLVTEIWSRPYPDASA